MKSRKGRCALQVRLCSSQSADSRSMPAASHGIWPSRLATLRPPLLFASLEMKDMRSASSCSQYQSAESAISLRKRASLAASEASVARPLRSERRIDQYSHANEAINAVSSAHEPHRI